MMTHIIQALKGGPSPHDVAELVLMTPEAYRLKCPGAPVNATPEGMACDARNIAHFLKEHLPTATLDALRAALADGEAAEEGLYQFSVSGRIPGDDEDTTLSFGAASAGEAKAAFESDLYANERTSLLDVFQRFKETIYFGEVQYVAGGRLRDASEVPAGFSGEWDSFKSSGKMFSELVACGFGVEDTGGGCTAMASPVREDGYEARVTDASGSRCMFLAGDNILFGIYEAETGNPVGDPIEKPYAELFEEIEKFRKDAPAAELPVQILDAVKSASPAPRG